MARRFVALVTSAFLVAAALAAPMTHVHDDHHAEGYGSPHTIHAHLSGHPAPPAGAGREPELQDDATDRTLYVQLFVAVAAAPTDVPAAVVSAFPVIAPDEAAAHVSHQIVHGHDPPLVGSVASRAPPSLLS